MDLEAVARHARSLEMDAAGQIESVLTGMRNLVPQLHDVWHGEDATRFENEWAQHEAQLTALHRALTDVVSSLNHSIAHQHNVSAH
jgi:WXG100 family type VII secretion target